MTNITYISISCDPPLLPSKDLIFFLCMFSASVKQIDSAITYSLAFFKSRNSMSVSWDQTPDKIWTFAPLLTLMPYDIYADNGVWLWYMSLPVKWQEQSYCSCLWIRASQMITLLWFCKSYVSTVYRYNQVPHLTQDTNKFSLVTMLTLDGFGRPSETISVTPWKLSGIWERIRSRILPSIMFAAGCFLMSVHWSKP